MKQLICLVLFLCITHSQSNKGCKYSDWESIPKCSVTCGIGVEIQIRTKHEYHGPDAEDCDEALTKNEVCVEMPCTPPQVYVPAHHVEPVVAFAGTAGLVGALAVLGESLAASLLPFAFAFGKRDVPDQRQIIDLLIEKLQEKRDMMR